MFFEPSAVDKAFGYPNDVENKKDFAFTYKTKFKTSNLLIFLALGLNT